MKIFIDNEQLEKIIAQLCSARFKIIRLHSMNNLRLNEVRNIIEDYLKNLDFQFLNFKVMDMFVIDKSELIEIDNVITEANLIASEANI